jgi:hypothetical protein
MTFLLKRKEMLRNKPRQIVFVLVAAVAAILGGYIAALAILAPEQLAEATVTASDVVCSGCVGTTDIADSAVTSAKIGSGQVANSDIANNAVGSAKIGTGQVGNSDIADSAVTSAKIGSGQVANSDIATSAVTSSKISDTSGVRSVDIVNGQVTSADIADGTITSTDIASGAIQLNVHEVQDDFVTVPPGQSGFDTADCPPGEIVTGGGFTSAISARVIYSQAEDEDTWGVEAINESDLEMTMAAAAICAGPMP